jgi:sensor histidine kinase regulating citrate/malate metabolism
MVKVAGKYGAAGGGILASLFLTLYFLNRSPLLYAKLIDVIILLILLVFAIREYRDIYNGGKIHFWQGMTVGILTYLFMAIISAVFTYIMTAIVDPNLLSHYIDTRMAMLQENKDTLIATIDERAYVNSLEGVKNTTVFDLALDDFLKKTIAGLIVTIAISVILRK